MKAIVMSVLLVIIISMSITVQTKNLDLPMGDGGLHTEGTSSGDHGKAIFENEHDIESQAKSNFYLAISILVTVVISGLIDVGMALFQ